MCRGTVGDKKFFDDHLNLLPPLLFFIPLRHPLQLQLLFQLLLQLQLLLLLQLQLQLLSHLRIPLLLWAPKMFLLVSLILPYCRYFYRSRPCCSSYSSRSYFRSRSSSCSHSSSCSSSPIWLLSCSRSSSYSLLHLLLYWLTSFSSPSPAPASELKSKQL